LTYVAMTRHREGVQLHVARDEFASRQAGVLVEHGKAPFEHDAANRASYFVTVETAAGERHTTWGVDLERAMAEAAPAIGDTIGLRHQGAVPVRLPDGTEVERNTWKVLGADELAWQRLESRLSRSGAKETTLDYREGGELVAAERQFAERRGIAESFGIRSEIEIAVEPAGLRAGRVSTAEDSALVRGPARKERADLAQDPRKDLDTDRQQRRSRFEGLNLSRSALPSPVSGAKPREQGRGAAAEAQPEKAVTARRGLFDGLKLGVGRGGSPEHAEASPVHRPAREAGLSTSPHEATPERDRLAERVRASSAFEAAVDRYARAHSAANRQVREGLPLLEGQKQELVVAGQQLDQVRPGAQALMQSALQHDPEARRVVAELAGRDRVGQLVAGMERERAALADPGVRAERFVERWNELKAERRTLTTGWHVEARQKVEAEMRGLAKTLERDPQVESLLRNRRQDLGIDRSARESAGLSHELEQSLTRGRNQNLGLGM
ncbi:Ti-type conjugative transfer relaxase TraA, partial [Pleomorphomonas carboxyditropha]